MSIVYRSSHTAVFVVYGKWQLWSGNNVRMKSFILCRRAAANNLTNGVNSTNSLILLNIKRSALWTSIRRYFVDMSFMVWRTHIFALATRRLDKKGRICVMCHHRPCIISSMPWISRSLTVWSTIVISCIGKKVQRRSPPFLDLLYQRYNMNSRELSPNNTKKWLELQLGSQLILSMLAM